ncbi:MAG: MerR family transcriptional regulator [Hyphomicrobiales bacterium]|nr:MerR family transcriptional regulator [Hyphomicrobiales bacterium]OQW82432.1 MAG: hypothetical protein BVN31_08510 [Proteobacteria bacterium ST_bin15]
MTEAEGRTVEADRPQAAFRTISEAADELDLPQHVLRFWETRFTHIRPLKRGGGRRYYRKDDVDLLRGIKHLLYGQGYTIKGVQRILKSQGVKFVQNVASNPASLKSVGESSDHAHHEALQSGPTEPQIAAGQSQIPAMNRDSADVKPAAIATATDFTYRPEAPSPHISEEGRRRLRAALSELMEARRLLLQPRPSASAWMSEDLDGG